MHNCDPEQTLQTDLSVNKHPGLLGGTQCSVNNTAGALKTALSGLAHQRQVGIYIP